MTEHCWWRRNLNTEGIGSNFQPLNRKLVMAWFEFQLRGWTDCTAAAALSWPPNSHARSHAAALPSRANTLAGALSELAMAILTKNSAFMDSLILSNLTSLAPLKVYTLLIFSCQPAGRGEGAAGKAGVCICTECQSKRVVLAPVEAVRRYEPAEEVIYKDNRAAKKSAFRFIYSSEKMVSEETSSTSNNSPRWLD